MAHGEILEEVRYALESTGWNNFTVEGCYHLGDSISLDVMDKDGNELQLNVEVKPAKS